METTTTAAPLTGPALLRHHHSDPSQRRADLISAAGHPSAVSYYQAIQTATEQQRTAAAAACPEAWHGPTFRDHNPERFALLTITTATGEQIGASLPLEAPLSGFSDADTYAAAEQLTRDHAAAYANAAQGPESFPLLVSIADRSGSASLFKIGAPTVWERSDGTTITDAPSITDDLAEGISRCERCGAIEDTDDGQTVRIRSASGWRFEAHHWCSDCADNHATSCDDCGDYYPNDEIHNDRAGRDICPECVEQSYYTCSDCGEICHEETHNTVDDSDSVCDGCIEHGDYHYHDGHGWSTEPPESDDDDEHQGPSPGQMRRYSYHTDANDTLGHTIPDTGHTYGAELEYKGSPDNWQAIASACRNRAILTNDSTVSGELVSVALTAGQIRRWLSSTAAALTGTRNDSNTGLHIHTDRRALTPWQWFTLAQYCATHAATLETIAGRPSNQWADLQSLPAHDWATFARSWRSRCWPTRYAGLNFYKGPTVEWRICRATKTPARALARFGMVQRMTALGRLAPSQRPQTAEALKGWLAQDRFIQYITGWEPGSYDYRDAAQGPTVDGDLPPAAPSVEQLQEMNQKVQSLEAELYLCERLRCNARRRLQNAPAGDTTYERGARSLWDHHRDEAERVASLVRAARSDRDQAEALASLTR